VSEPTTEAGRRLGVDVEQELGVQFKSADAYRGWLATANALATAIEAEARADAEITWKADEIRTAFAAGQAEARAEPPALDVAGIVNSFRYSRPLGHGDSLVMWERNEETLDAILARLAREASDGA